MKVQAVMKQKLLLSLCILLMLLPLGSSLADEAVFLSAQPRSGAPLEMQVQARLIEHMPFDEVRTGWLNDLLAHITFTVRSQSLDGERWSQLSLRVDDDEALGITDCTGNGGSQVQLSVLPDVIYTRSAGEETALDTLLGEAVSAGGLYGLDGSEVAWREDGEALLYAVQDACAEQMTNRAYRETITSYTTVARRKTLSVASEDAEAFRETLLSLCPEGNLRDLLAALVFSGKQTLTLYTLEDGTIIQATHAGRMGTDEDHLRQVNITWKMLRKDYLVKDDLSIKSPSVSDSSSTDYDTITYARRLEEKDGTAALTSSFSWKRRVEKRITTTSGTLSLNRATLTEGEQVTGTVTLTLDPPLEDNEESTALTVDLLFPGSPDTLSGTVNVTQKYNGKVRESAELTLRLQPCEAFTFALTGSEQPLDGMEEDALAALRETLQQRAAAAIVRPLVLLPREETYFFSYELPDESWQRIVDAAQAGVQ